LSVVSGVGRTVQFGKGIEDDLGDDESGVVFVVGRSRCTHGECPELVALRQSP